MKASIVATTLLTLAAPSAAQQACPRVHILVGRGSLEAAGMGATGRLVNQMKSAITGVTAEAIDYPAKLSPYSQSSAAGTNAVVKQTTAYVKRCPNAKIVLMGYSQVSVIMKGHVSRLTRKGRGHCRVGLVRPRVAEFGQADRGCWKPRYAPQAFCRHV
jgi:acetylxylan esterase